MMRRAACLVTMLLATSALAQDTFKGAEVTGAGTATCIEATLPRGCVYLPVSGAGAVTFRLSGTWAGTVVVEGSPDGDAADVWVALDIHTLATGAWTMAASTTAIGTYAVAATGMRTLRLRASVYASGTIVVDSWTHSDPWSVVYSRAADGSLQVSTGVGASSLGKAEDAVHGTGDVGIMSLGVRNDTFATALSGTDGDYTPVGVDAQGRIGIAQFPDNEPVNAAQWGGTAVAGGTGVDTAGAPRVSLATNVPLPAGTNDLGGVEVTRFAAAATPNVASAAVALDPDLVAAVANTRLVFAQCAEAAAGAAAATVTLRHGVLVATVCSGNAIGVPIELAPNETGDPIFWERGWGVASGVCMDVTGGTVICNTATIVEAAP